MRATRLRARIRRGRRALKPAEIAWMRAYERAHPPREGVTTLADAGIGPDTATPVVPARGRTFAVDAAGSTREVVREATQEEYAALAGEVPAPPEPEPELEPEEPEPELSAMERKARAAADLYDHAASQMVAAVEMHARVSERAIDMMERMHALVVQQSEQLVDATTALAEQRAEALAPLEDDEPPDERKAAIDDEMMGAFKEWLGGRAGGGKQQRATPGSKPA